MSAMNAVQLIGMPEADCIVAQCAVYLARAPKSTETYAAMNKCKRDIAECKGPQPSVPLHLRNAPTKLMKELGNFWTFQSNSCLMHIIELFRLWKRLQYNAT